MLPRWHGVKLMRTLFARAITAGALAIKRLLTLFANMLRVQRIFSIILIARCRARSAFDSPSRDDQPRLVDVSGIASDDPEYAGPHLIQPQLFANMFEYGRHVVAERFGRELAEKLQR
jgi:hypothetical protein